MSLPTFVKPNAVHKREAPMPTSFAGKRFSFTQPDGTVLQVRGWGNQYHAAFETLDGYTVVRDPVSGFSAVSERIAQRLGARAYPRTTTDGHWIIEVLSGSLSPHDQDLLEQTRGPFQVSAVDPVSRTIVARPAFPE